MDYRRIRRLTEKQFYKTLSREGMEIGSYYDPSKTYKVFFRKLERSETPNFKIRLYYPTEYNIDIGTVITIDQEPYIIYSSDAFESRVYKTSVAYKCDTIIDIQYNGSVVGVPVVLLTDTWKVAHSTISVVAGACVLYAQDNIYTNSLRVNDGFYLFGNYYTLGNKFTNQGITYLYMEQGTRPVDNYTIDYLGDSTRALEDGNYQTEWVVSNNGAVVTPQPTLSYTSSNDNIATISAEGILTPISAGDVVITANYAAGSASKAVTITITEEQPPTPSRTFSVTGGGTQHRIYIGGSGSVMTFHAFDEGVEDTLDYLADNHTLTWSGSSADIQNVEQYLQWTPQSDANKVKVKLVNYYEGVDKNVRINALIDGSIVAYVDLTTYIAG